MKTLMVVLILAVSALCQSTTITHEDGTKTTVSCHAGNCDVFDPDFAGQVDKMIQTQQRWCRVNHIKKGVACENAWQNGFRGKMPVCGPEHHIGEASDSCWETVSK